MSSDADASQSPRRGPPKGDIFRFKKFNTKFLLATAISVLLGAVLNVVVARQGINKLSEESSREIESGLNSANREYLTNHIGDKALQTSFTLGHAYADLEILAGLMQDMLDRGEDLQPLYDRMAAMPLFQRDIAYNEKANWYETRPGDQTVLTVWGYLGDRGAIRPDVQKEINSTALLELMLPAFHKHGASKLQIYYVGPRDKPYARMAPHTALASYCDKIAPGHNEKPWYDFFFTGLVDGWLEWTKVPGGVEKRANQITVTAPYEDAAGGGLVMTAFHPLWSKDRKSFAGSVALDLTLSQLVASIKDVKLAKTGFAFLTQADGNVFAVNDAGAKTMGLQVETKEAGLAFLQRHIKDSMAPDVAALALPKDDRVDYHYITIADEQHIMVLQRLSPLNSFNSGAGIATEHWTLGFVVPKKEMYASLIAAQDAIQQTRTSIISSQLIVTAASFLVLMVGMYLVSGRMTGALVALSGVATKMRRGDYGARVEVRSEDEIGQLSVVFNDMADEIQAYTGNLEGLVQERTKDLEAAADEIRELNAKLAQENLRLGAELDVARRLQLMVLPPVKELQEIPGLDIAGYMAPADEVGGDYYDVLRSDGLVKMGIGDVTGHGLESGVLMLMVQTAVRTLLVSNEQDPRRFLNIVNKVIYENVKRISSDKNLTLSLIDYRDGILKLTGQHEDLIIVRQDGTLERIDTTDLGLPVGLDFDISEYISSIDVRLDPGDVATLFTDGVTEADNVDHRQYGIERLCEVIRQNHTLSSKQIKEAIVADVMSHIGKSKIYDDITVLVIKRR